VRHESIGTIVAQALVFRRDALIMTLSDPEDLSMRWTRWLTLLRLTGRDALTLFSALSDPQMPRRLKAGVLALVIYVLSPIDLLPDFALMLGWADDLALLIVGIPWLAYRLPEAVRERARLRVARWLRDAPGPRNP
jgi:uncharacterized membrane protein YkvA (DUF1232 family)